MDKWDVKTFLYDIWAYRSVDVLRIMFGSVMGGRALMGLAGLFSGLWECHNAIYLSIR